MGDTGGASGGGRRSTEETPAQVTDLLGVLARFMEQQRAREGGHGATKALKAVVSKIGKFDGRNITNFLKSYVWEMEVHEVSGNRMRQAFSLAVIPEIRERVEEIQARADVTSWAAFAERMRYEYCHGDSERMTMRIFRDWVEQRPGKNSTPTELVRNFERKFNQLTLAERRLLDVEKVELFMQAADGALVNKLFPLVVDRDTERGLTNDWRRVEEAVNLVDKFDLAVFKGATTETEGISEAVSRAPKVTTTPSPLPVASKKIDEGALDEIIKGIRDLRVDMNEIKKNQGSSSSQPSDRTKPFPRRCIWCDIPDDHTLRGCSDLDIALKEGVVVFIDGKLHEGSTKLPVNTNFGKGGMKKLMEEKMGRASALFAKEPETFHIEVGQYAIEASPAPSREIMRRGAQTIRNQTGWSDPVDASSIRAFLGKIEGNSLEHDALVEEKRGRTTETDDVDEPASKKKSAAPKDGQRGDGPSSHTRQRPPRPPAFVHPGDGPLPDDGWGGPSSIKKAKEKEDPTKGKAKAPAYKLQSDIESSIDMKGILEERILDAKIEFTLREALGIAKKDFHELIIDVIKRKRQMTAEAVMMRALDTHMTKDEEMEIGQVFALMAGPVVEEERVGKAPKEEYDELFYDCTSINEEEEMWRAFAQGCVMDGEATEVKSDHDKMVDRESEGVGELKTTNHHTPRKEEEDRGAVATKIFGSGKVTTVANVHACAHGIAQNEGEEVDYSQPFWARATTETRVKLGELDDVVLALVDHGSEINIMSRKVYNMVKWPIDRDHGWFVRDANNGRGELYGACPAISATIGDVEVEQNFFVHNHGTYPVILGQPYITASRMETKVLDDGSHFARIRSGDGKKSVQFMTVKPNHDRHRVQLREVPLPTSLGFPDF